MHAEVHPKISDNGVDRGQYPREFEHPRRVEWFLSLDSKSLRSNSLTSPFQYPMPNLPQAAHSTVSANPMASPQVASPATATPPSSPTSASNSLAVGDRRTLLMQLESIDS